MILSSSSLDFFNPPYIVALTGLLWISLTDTYNNNFVTSCGSVWPSIFTFRQSLIIGDSKTCWWCIIQLWRDIFICSSIFEFTTHTLLPLPYSMLWSKYDAHMAWLYFYMFHLCGFSFFPDLLFLAFWLISLSFLK